MFATAMPNLPIKGVSRDEITRRDRRSDRPIVISTLANLSDEDFAKTYPIEVFGQPMTTGYFLTHLATHLNYHLGQINYHRRLVAGNQVNFQEAESYLLSLGNEVETMKLGLENITSAARRSRKSAKQLFESPGRRDERQRLGLRVFGFDLPSTPVSETGVFTSPHLVSITERIRIGGVDITRRRVCETRHAGA